MLAKWRVPEHSSDGPSPITAFLKELAAAAWVWCTAALQRFQQEARMASALDHSNICTIYEIGEHAGLPFIAMQYLEGQTLERRITDKPLPVEQVVTRGILLRASPANPACPHLLQLAAHSFKQ